MGANAQTTVPTFTASQVLTAAQMNESARTGVPVFATTVTRDAAFGGTGEKTLAEGQMCYVEGTGLQTYNGTAWVTWGTGAGFVRISGETTFSAASSVTLDGCFTSTYRNYKLVVNYTTSTTNVPRFRVRTGNASISTNTYNEQYVLGSSTSALAASNTSTSSIWIGNNTGGSFNSSAEIMIYNPQIATPTTLASTLINSAGAYTAPLVAVYGGNNSNATSYDGFELFVATGTFTGNYTLYGLAIS